MRDSFFPELVIFGKLTLFDYLGKEEDSTLSKKIISIAICKEGNGEMKLCHKKKTFFFLTQKKKISFTDKNDNVRKITWKKEMFKTFSWFSLSF